MLIRQYSAVDSLKQFSCQVIYLYFGIDFGFQKMYHVLIGSIDLVFEKQHRFRKSRAAMI